MFKILFFVSALCLSQALAFTGSDAIAVLAGFMAAVVQKDDLKEMQTCAKDADLLTGDVERIISDVSSLSFSGFFDAIYLAGRVMGEAPFVLRDCETLQEDLATLETQAQIFTHIGELTERITKNYIWHYTEIMTDISKANEAATQGNYYSFGELVGDAVFVALQP